MYWRYGCKKTIYHYTITNTVETLYELMEVYPETEDMKDSSSYTENAVTIQSDKSKQDLAKWLRLAADDIEKYNIIDGGIVKIPF